ncbi:MAG: hypothetical protein ACE5E1_05195, partial [Phycisphaerae bacterium]
MMRDHAQLAGMTLRFTAACALAAAGPSQTCATPDPVSIPPMVGYIWQTMTTRDGLPDDRIGTIRIVDDSIWVGTDRGLAVLTGGVWKTWNHVDRSKRTPLPPVSAIDIDRRTGDLWLGTRGAGLLRLSGGRFDRFDQMNSGLAGDFVFALAVVDGRVWAATNGGVSVYDPIPREWTLYLERRTDSPETPITDLRPDRAGLSLYATAWCAGVRRFGTRTGRLDSVSLAPSTRAVDHDDSAKAIGAALAVDCSAGVLWCATPRRLYRRDVDGTWASRPIPADVTRGSFVRCLAARSTSQAWLGTDGGLLVLANWSSNTWARYGARKPDASPRAAVGRDGVVAEHVPIPT